MNDFDTKLEAVFESLVKDAQRRNITIPLLEEIESATFFRDGFAKGTVTTIGGATGIGKSLLAINLTYELTVNGNAPVLFLTLQDTCDLWMRKFMAVSCEIRLDRMMNGQLDQSDWERLDKHLGLLEGSSIVLEVDTREICQICDFAKKTKEEKGIQYIIIDYLQLIDVANSQPSYRYADYAYIMRKLKALAIELDVPIIIFSEIKKRKELSSYVYDDSCKPILADFRGSDSIVEDSDVVMLIDRPEYYKIYRDENGHDIRGMFIIQVEKENYSGLFNTILLRFDSETGKMKVPGSEGAEIGNNNPSSKKELPPSPGFDDGPLHFRPPF